MNWITTDIPKNLRASVKSHRTATHVIALWDHSKCRGWQLYSFRSYTRTKWIAGAGADSVAWTDDLAIAWAEQQIASQPADVSKPQIEETANGGSGQDGAPGPPQEPTG